MAKTFLFSSESVGEGHPDKMCDQISDAILDACLKEDPDSKVACETATKTGFVMVFGEIRTNAKEVNYQKIVRQTVKGIGYDHSDKCFDGETCGVLVSIEDQSNDIAGGVHEGRKEEDVGAGDQGIMMGYATDETKELMPLTCVLAHNLNKKMAEYRRDGILPWIRADTKSMVTVEYMDDKGACVPKRVHTVLISAHHSSEVTKDLKGSIKDEVFEKVVKQVIPAKFLDSKTIFHFNPTGKFEIGGPQGDAGLTGRKIIVDTYGGWGAHGGGAFSGKDATKVDRSASYCARWIAKSLVAAGLARRVLVQIAYAIGIAKPLAINVYSHGTSSKTDDELREIVEKNFDLRPGKIIEALDLKQPIYQRTACYGHFGRPEFAWENPKELSF